MVCAANDSLIVKEIEMSQQVNTGAVHHVTLTVSDVKRSTAFYTNLLGFQVAVEFEPRIALSNGTLLLVLTPPPDPAQAIPGDRFDENRIGLDHISLAVKDLAELQAAAALLDENGVTRGEIKDLGPGFGINVMAVRDPDNIQLELTAPYGG
jgi:glyoxylase I family protein